jgi:hypothetical protein
MADGTGEPGGWGRRARRGASAGERGASSKDSSLINEMGLVHRLAWPSRGPVVVGVRLRRGARGQRQGLVNSLPRGRLALLWAGSR